MGQIIDSTFHRIVQDVQDGMTEDDAIEQQPVTEQQVIQKSESEKMIDSIKSDLDFIRNNYQYKYKDEDIDKLNKLENQLDSQTDVSPTQQQEIDQQKKSLDLLRRVLQAL